MNKRLISVFMVLITIQTLAFGQSPTQHYKDALLFDLKGHVKECMIQRNEKDYGTYNFKISGEYISDENQWMVKHDDSGKMTFSQYYQEIVFASGFVETNYVYNANNQLVEKSGSEPFDMDRRTFKTTYEYDSNGFVIKEIKEKEYSQTITITYNVISCDTKGNWTKRTCTTDETDLFAPIGYKPYTETRTIKYY